MGPNTFDCAGLIWYLYYSMCSINLFDTGVGLSTTTRIMTSNYGILTLFEERYLKKDLKLIREGDVIFFHRQSLQDTEPKYDNKYPGHCGLYLGNNSFIHASRPKQQVIISNFNNNPYWLDVLVGSKDFFSDKKILEKVRK